MAYKTHFSGGLFVGMVIIGAAADFGTFRKFAKTPEDPEDPRAARHAGGGKAKARPL